MIAESGQFAQQFQRQYSTQQLHHPPAGERRDHYAPQTPGERRIYPGSIRERSINERLIPEYMQACEAIFCGKETQKLMRL